MEMEPTPIFPSTAHEKLLTSKLQSDGWKAFSIDEKMWWHSYVYAWRRVFLGLWENILPPTDRDGKWFARRMVEEAYAAAQRGQLWKEHKSSVLEERKRLRKHRDWLAEIYRRAHDAGETLPQDLRDDDPRIAKAIHKFAINPEHRLQNQERATAAAKIIQWRDRDGNPTPEALDYAELCMRQVRTNVATFVANSKMPTEET